ncbi:heavy-metal-associated domain-containing protein [Methylophaga thalassica]|jgi:copper chaperone|uniref:heavy-metal-associated domain-containing protein n=1 Tax=Methylophaga thalassica TaxID=40223 RepID=UPI002E7B9375|nr:heavy-metal-associated domain-containing protein [Methylophaga thalassica]WVI83760.1 heavy-metal-associated domain-containing protein [Methylophaga thalassica]|tara:strand:+ start:7931 stop:8185 length:255 start_codon:yes stop_codon:yes gene_type:complete
MQTERLKVTGMTCSGCTSKVSQALNGINGVSDVDVSLAAGEATVKFDEWLTSPDQLKSTIESVGYGVDEANATLSHKGKGGCCS